MPKKQNQSETQAHKIYVFISSTDNQFFVGKTTAKTADVAYKYHATGKHMTNNKVDAEAICDFRRRHEDMEKNLPQMRQRFEDAKEAYRRMKKLQYQTQLAENKFFCYGPKYSPERAEQRKDRGVQVTAKEFDRYSQER